MMLKAVVLLATYGVSSVFGLGQSDIPSSCSLKNSFMEHGPANRFEFCHGLTLTQTDLESAKNAYVRTQTDPNDKLFWARFIKKEKTFKNGAETIKIEDDNQYHILRHFVSDPEADCAAFSFDMRNKAWEAGLGARADIVNFLYKNNNNEYQVAVCVFNCHLNNRKDPAFEAENCSNLANLFIGAHDFDVVNCVLENVDNPSKCNHLMK